MPKIHFLPNDLEIENLVSTEERRQEGEINLIASENYVPPLVRTLLGSALTNKYAEGYPGKRYYAGCHVVDEIESMAIERCKALFKAEHANVQPHSGSQANMSLYATLLKPGDTIMGMDLASGGHLTHGHAVNFSGIFYKSVQYGVHPATERLDYDAIADLAAKHKPQLIIAGASAYSRTIDFERMGQIAKSVNAFFAADIAHIAGLIAAGLHPSPVEHADVVSSTTHKTLRGPRGGFLLSKSVYKDRIDRSVLPGVQGGPLMHVIAAKATAFLMASMPDFVEYQHQVIINAQAMTQVFLDKGYRIVSGGTDNHLFVIDLRSHNLTGLRAQRLLEEAGIILSRSCIPFDPTKPWVTSGIRIGTPALTTRGFNQEQVCTVAEWIDMIIRQPDNEPLRKQVREMGKQLCAQFPIYTDIQV